MSLRLRRIARLAGMGSPRLVQAAIRRELALRRERVRLMRALGGGGPLLVGPFLGEVGYELLYWRPFVLALLRRHRVDPVRVTVIGRGGVGGWYRDVAARYLDAFELLGADRVREGMDARVARTGERKQTDVDGLDRELLGLAGPGDAVHPLHMYWRTRFVWEGLRPSADAKLEGDYDDLPRSELAPALERVLPPRYLAVKAYTNEAVSGARETAAAFARIVETLARDVPVVLLTPPRRVDDHEDIVVGGARKIDVGHLLEPATNLAQQAEVVARSEGLVSTYGGFSYLGPFLGVPTIALNAGHEANRRHEDVLRAVRPAARYERLELFEAAELADLASRLAG